MERLLIPSRKTIFWLLLLIVLLWHFWSYLFPKQLDNSDIVLMKKSYTGQEKNLGGGIWAHRSYYICVGVKNVSKARPSQYKDFLPKVAAQIADTTREKVYIYFLMYDHGIEHSVHTSSPYKLEENEPGAFLLMQHWDCGKEPEFTRWYIPALKSLNTEVPDILHLDDTRVEQVK